MKRLLIAGFFIFASVSGYCVNQPNNIGYAQTDSPFSLGPKTKAQLNALTPDTTGEILSCSDCTTTIICVSSGSNPSTSAGAWVCVSSAASVAAMTHCQ